MFNLFLQTAATSQTSGGSAWSMWIFIILMFVVMWFFMIRPQRKQQKALEEMRSRLSKGDKVVTAGGIYGTVAEVDDRTVLIKVDGEVKLRVDKSSIQLDTTAASSTPTESKSQEKK